MYCCVSVQTLRLTNTGLTGQLPVLWGVSGSFPNMTTLDISRNIISGVPLRLSPSQCAVSAHHLEAQILGVHIS